jgi:5-methylcytosine-specific restriction protein A
VTPGRKVKEWIGKTPDTPVPEVVQLRSLLAHDRKDWRTGQDIRPGDHWHCDHKIALCNGGKNRETNVGPILVESHKKKTAEDREEKRKTDAMVRAAYGINKSKRPITGGKPLAKGKGRTVPQLPMPRGPSEIARRFGMTGDSK